MVTDGVLDEPEWQSAPIATGFVQSEPHTGMAATENTEVRVLFDADVDLEQRPESEVRSAIQRAYARESTAQAVIDAVTNQLLPATKNAELKALEEKVAPNFQAHLAAGKQVQQKLER